MEDKNTMNLQLSESIEIKYARLSKIEIIKMEISSLEKEISDLSDDVRKIENEDVDYNQYKSNFGSYSYVKYSTYCNLLKIYMDSENDEILSKFDNYFKLYNVKKNDFHYGVVQNDIWDKTLKTLKNELTENSYNTWIKTIKFLKIVNNTIYLELPNQFNLGIVESRYKTLLQNSISLISKENYKIELVERKSN
jgi:hypothetical protein